VSRRSRARAAKHAKSDAKSDSKSDTKADSKKKAKRADANAKINAEIDAGVEGGGLAVFERDGKLFHFTPPEMANSLRFFLAHLQQSDEVPQQSIAITSALEGEGVTSVSRGLAALLGHDLDLSVCLLETNWWVSAEDGGDPKWWQTFGEDPLSERPGLSGVLNGTCSLDFALLPTSDPRLTVLPSGRLPVAHRPAAASSNAFTDVVELLTKRFDAVVIDAPPVLKASEATTIVRHAEAVALVVRQGVTTEQQVKLAIEELEGTELLGVILNRTSTRLPGFVQRFTVPN
jgi:receptor protein-tyrosine kinase